MRLRECVFCQRSDSLVKITEEDVLSKWLDDVLTPELLGPDRTAERTFMNALDQRRNARAEWKPRKLAGVRIAAVCRECNNGWMSGYDALAKRLLLPAIEGSPTSFSVEEQISLATWITMKSMVLEFGWGAQSATSFDSADRSLLMTHRIPPARTQVRVAAVRTVGFPVRLFHRTHVRGDPTVAALAEELVTCVTLTVGCFVIQSFADPRTPDGALRHGPVAAARYTQFFPPARDAAAWPPPTILVDSEIDGFADPLRAWTRPAVDSSSAC